MQKIKVLSILCGLLVGSVLYGQTSKTAPLPVKTLQTMIDSTTSMDVVLLIGEGGSLSTEGPGVIFFNSFIENKPAEKTNSKPAGNIMWLINGREFISGNYFLGDSTGYIVFQKDGKEYVNQLNARGNTFFKQQIK
jgi:hypothetical protein